MAKIEEKKGQKCEELGKSKKNAQKNVRKKTRKMNKKNQKNVHKCAFLESLKNA